MEDFWMLHNMKIWGDRNVQKYIRKKEHIQTEHGRNAGIMLTEVSTQIGSKYPTLDDGQPSRWSLPFKAISDVVWCWDFATFWIFWFPLLFLMSNSTRPPGTCILRVSKICWQERAAWGSPKTRNDCFANHRIPRRVEHNKCHHKLDSLRSLKDMAPIKRATGKE